MDANLTGLDYLHLDTCSGGYLYLFVLTNHFSRFVQVYTTTNKFAKTAADPLHNNFVMRYWLPEKILHALWKQFENNVWKILQTLSNKNAKEQHHAIPNQQTNKLKAWTRL